MDSGDPQTNRPGNSTKPVDRQSKFDPTRDRENQRRAWENLAAIERGLRAIEEGISIAEEYDREAKRGLARFNRLDRDRAHSTPDHNLEQPNQEHKRRNTDFTSEREYASDNLERSDRDVRRTDQGRER